MTETSVNSGGQILSAGSRTRSVSSFSPAQRSQQLSDRESGFGPVLQDSQFLNTGALDNNVATLRDAPIPGGSALLSTPVLFALAETRTQEAEAARTFPAPSNIERAIGSYTNTASSIRETIIGRNSIVR
ncbi:hypothetical protein [Kordiimonas sp. SCSIO 12610]|uniref:hypothetical protein n=1 Tax=Kordiimonas sp. SCSIO 12610 TaxID=2829597 RepID=UPI002108DEC1|nr:hypothetical protein [Kordiimonas sp. SCSIO 12610]UTW54864.1 hypothetical protein KFF44_13785 [Kordiimonas sp. SCSIO 12610]